ncbi:MAG: nitroreductase [Chloroflexi bacterium]|nr:MAG: nitroreductase [Chloroflexota bacterium]
MEIHEALYTTRAMRRLRPDPVPLDVQARILDAAIRAPNVEQQWRFLLVDDRDVIGALAPLYRIASEKMLADFGITLADLVRMGGPQSRTARSALYLVEHFHELPLLLIGFSPLRGGAGIYPALWSAMLAARAEGVGSTLTTILGEYCAPEAFEILGVPPDAGWNMHAVVPMGYPLGRWAVAPRRPVHEVAARNSWNGDLGFTVDAPLWSPG